jgi:hypothetical protein
MLAETLRSGIQNPTAEVVSNPAGMILNPQFIFTIFLIQKIQMFITCFLDKQFVFLLNYESPFDDQHQPWSPSRWLQRSLEEVHCKPMQWKNKQAY